MTGIFVRVQRDGRWQNAEFDQLSDAEMQQVVDRALANAPTPFDAALDAWSWALALARWWEHVGRFYWLVIDPADLAYLDAVWKGER